MLRIRLFGNLEIQSSGRGIAAFPTENSRRLFAFLILNPGRRYARESLASRFWQTRAKSTALKYLRAELWRLRRVVETSEAPSCVHATRREVGFNRAAVQWIDAEEFEARLSPLSAKRGEDIDPAQACSVQGAVDLYRGDLLEDVYDEWATVYRERMRELFLHGLELLIRHHAARGAWADAVTHSQHLLSIDPLREHIQRQLIRFHYLRGDRAAAIQQYASCKEVLKRELDVQPMAETQELNRSIQSQQILSSDVFRSREHGLPHSVNGSAFHPKNGHDIAAPAASSRVVTSASKPTWEQKLDAALDEIELAERRLTCARDLLRQARAEQLGSEDG